MVTTPGLMVTNLRTQSTDLKPDSRLADEGYREQSIREWQDDGTFVARLATPEERAAYVAGLPAMQAMREEMAAFEKKEEALLKGYGFDPAMAALLKHRALLTAARELPRGMGEWAGNTDNWFSRVPVVGGGYAAAIMGPVILQAHRLEKGEQLSQEELAMLDDTLVELQRPNTWPANTLSMTVDSASIATEMYLTMGIGTAVREGATKLTEEAFAHALKKFASQEGRDLIRKQMATRGLAGAAGVAAQTITGTGSRVLYRAAEDLATSGVTVTQDDLDRYVGVLDATQRPGSVWEAVGKAARYQFLENTSEKLGSVIRSLGGDRVVKAALDKLSKPAQERLSKQALFIAVAKLNPGKRLEAVQGLLARGNVDSLHVEYLEEVLAPGLHTVFDGEEFNLPSTEDVASLAVTMAVTGTAMTVANWRDGHEGKGGAPPRGTPLGQALRLYDEPETGPSAAAPQGVLPPQHAVLETSVSGNGGASSSSAGVPGEVGALEPALADAAASNGTQMQAASAATEAGAPNANAIGTQAEDGEAQLESAMAGQAAGVNASGAGTNSTEMQSPLVGEASSQQVPVGTAPQAASGGGPGSPVQVAGDNGLVEGSSAPGLTQNAADGANLPTDTQVHETGGMLQQEKQPADPPVNRLSGTNWSHTRVTASNPGNGKRLEDHSDHASAMAGDTQAADRVVQEVVSEAELKDTATRHPKARIVTLPSARASGKADPLSSAYARRMAAATGLPVSEEITVDQPALHPGSSLIRRMAFRPRFKGKVERGAEYVVVAGEMDAVELATFRHFIERNHGRVVEIRGLGGADAVNVPITQETAEKVKEKFGIEGGINVTLRANGFYGGVIGAMTEAEAQEMLKFESASAFERHLVEEARQELVERNSGRGASMRKPTAKQIRESRGTFSWEPKTKADSNILSEYKEREGLKGKDRDRNASFVQGEILGEALERRFSLSGENTPGPKLRKGRYFETVTVKHPRHYDAEVFLLEGLAHEIMERTRGDRALAKGEIELVSEFKYCASCQGVIQMFREMFREMFPNVKLNLRGGD